LGGGGERGWVGDVVVGWGWGGDELGMGCGGLRWGMAWGWGGGWDEVGVGYGVGMG